MGYPNKGSSYSGLKSDTTIEKTDRDKLKQFAKQLKSMFATKIDLKDKNLERELGDFLILNIQDYIPLKPLMITKSSLVLMNSIESSIT